MIDGKKIIDEMCTCGHLQSDHDSSITNDATLADLTKGHGACAKCECAKYRWAHFVFESEE